MYIAASSDSHGNGTFPLCNSHPIKSHDKFLICNAHLYASFFFFLLQKLKSKKSLLIILWPGVHLLKFLQSFNVGVLRPNRHNLIRRAQWCLRIMIHNHLRYYDTSFPVQFIYPVLRIVSRFINVVFVNFTYKYII